MATKPLSRINIEIQHGSKKIPVEISIPEIEKGDVLTVRRCKEKLYELTGVPPESQRLIHKGKSLMDPECSLHSLGIKNGSKVMLLGQKPIPQDKQNMDKLKELESKLDKLDGQLSDIIYQSDSIHRGFAPEETKGQQVKQLRKELISTNQNFMKLIETLDSLHFDETNKGGRGKKKTLTDRILTLLDRCDKVLTGIDDICIRFEYY